MGFVNNINFVWTGNGLVCAAVQNVAHVIHPGVAGGIHFHNVHMGIIDQGNT